MYTNGPRKTNTAALTQIALCVALLCISSYLVIPLPFTPVVLSMHTVAVNITGLLLRPRHAFLAVCLYLLMGLIGLPVFSGGTAGPDKLLGPIGGFYFGFLFAATAISLLKGKKALLWRYILITICIGIPIQHCFAILFMGFYNKISVLAALSMVSLPFLPGDILKCIGASIIALALKKQMRFLS